MQNINKSTESKSHSWPVYLYILAGILTIYARVQNPFGPASLLEISAKSMLMPLLALWYIMDCGKIDAFARLILAALFFSWGGDVLLLFTTQNESFFILGLVSFLIAHLFYIGAFLGYPKKAGRGLIRQKPLVAIPVVVYMAALMWVLTPNLEEMAIPVFVYATAICFMALAAINRSGRTNRSSYTFILLGALTFVLSDSMIAINKFYHPFESAGALIMLSYIVAQYLIVIGAFYQNNPPVSE